MPSQYTPRQGQYLAFIHYYTVLQGRPPSELDMVSHFNVSPPAVHQMIVGLENRGLISRTPGQPRSIRVLVSPKYLSGLDDDPAATRMGSAFKAAYPALACWVMEGGCAVLGQMNNTNSNAMALNETGIVSEAGKAYDNIEDLLADLNRGIAEWNIENG